MRTIKLFEEFSDQGGKDYRKVTFHAKKNLDKVLRPDDFKTLELKEIGSHLGLNTIEAELKMSQSSIPGKDNQTLEVHYGLQDWSEFILKFTQSKRYIKIGKREDGYFIVQDGAGESGDYYECDGLIGLKECLSSLIV